MQRVQVQTESAAQTEALGAALARVLAPGDIVLIEGDLGTGKTTLVRGACVALGVTENIASPTFVIGRSYAGRVPVSHLDLYRLESLDGEDPSLLGDYLTPEAVAFVEWPERADASELGEIAARIKIEHAGEDLRTIEVLGNEAAVGAIA